MRITLIRANMGDHRSADAMPPLAMGILAARAVGHEVRFFDDKTEPIPQDIDADLVALSVETFTARRSYQIADGFRRRGMPVVMGGYHPTLLPDEALQHADAVVTGDAEGVWEALLDDLITAACGRIYRSDNSGTLEDFRVDRSIFAGKRYAPIELVQYGRGCRFACDFCSIHISMAAQVRTRPAEDVRVEIEGLDSRRLLLLVDDNLFQHGSESRCLAPGADAA